jgi:hypothetical protein
MEEKVGLGIAEFGIGIGIAELELQNWNCGIKNVY